LIQVTVALVPAQQHTLRAGTTHTSSRLAAGRHSCQQCIYVDVDAGVVTQILCVQFNRDRGRFDCVWGR
jgi:hypothetical protein